MAQDVQAERVVTIAAFADRVAEAVEAKRSQLVVGLDPVAGRLPPELLRGAGTASAVARFCCGIVDAVAEHAVAVKPQWACFEALGSDGVHACEEACSYARAAGLLVIADAKRGDIGATAEAYAAAFLRPRGEAPPLADALTVNPYLGGDALEPFLAACREHGGGIFCLVKTSNRGGADVQDVRLAGGGTLWQHVAGLVDGWGDELVGACGLSSVGAVVGATFPEEVVEARRLLPRAVLLLPGIGAQGAAPADVAGAFAAGRASALVAASRSVIYARPTGGGSRLSAAGDEARRLARETWSVSGG